MSNTNANGAVDDSNSSSNSNSNNNDNSSSKKRNNKKRVRSSGSKNKNKDSIDTRLAINTTDHMLALKRLQAIAMNNINYSLKNVMLITMYSLANESYKLAKETDKILQQLHLIEEGKGKEEGKSKE